MIIHESRGLRNRFAATILVPCLASVAWRGFGAHPIWAIRMDVHFVMHLTCGLHNDWDFHLQKRNMCYTMMECVHLAPHDRPDNDLGDAA